MMIGIGNKGLLRLTAASLLLLAVVCGWSRADSLWSEGPRRVPRNLYGDLKARWLNDLVTVVIEETSSASQKSSSTSERDHETEAEMDAFYPPFNLLSKLPSWKWKSGKKDSGEGETTRQDSVKAVISARVVEVLPNGCLVIEGERAIKVNNDSQKILLTGTVRPADIGPDNTVYSSRVMNLKITYRGKGPMADKQRRGFLGWLLDVIWPF